MKWLLLRRDARCAYGCDVSRGRWVLSGRQRRWVPRFIVCERHAKEHYNQSRPEARDGKAAALGNDE